MSYVIKTELAQAILNYLGAQPYAQVAPLIGGLQQLGEVDDAALAAFLNAQQEVPEEATEVPENNGEDSDA